jgi:hypothetical protein
MNTFAYEEPDDHEVDQPLPGRPRRRLLTRGTATLTALLLGVVGFLVGIKVEKTHQSGSSTSALSSTGGTPTGSGASASSRSAGGTSSRAGASPSGASGQSGSSSTSGLPGGSGAPSATGNTGAGTAGTVTGISKKTVFLKSSSGATVQIKLTSATKLTKDLTVSRNSLRPGDAVVVTGISGSNGSIKAASISDSGASSSSSNSNSSSGSS